MLIANPVYSWLVSKVNKDRVVLYTYLFFILNLILFFMGWNFLDASGRVFIAKAFYIWCNVFSFFVVSIFWVAMINHFSSNQAKLYFGIVSAGGSLGLLLVHPLLVIFRHKFVVLQQCPIMGLSLSF